MDVLHSAYTSIFSSIGVFAGYSIAAFIGWQLIKKFILETFRINIEGKTVIVTGCDSGFGRMAARRLTRHGCLVIAACLMDDSLNQVNEPGTDCEDHTLIHPLKLNLKSEYSINDFVAKAKEIVEKNNSCLHALVNNAGVMRPGPAEWNQMVNVRMMMDIHYLGVANLSVKLASLLGASKGRLVGLTSLAAICPSPFVAAYGASKAAIDMWYSSLRMENERGFSVHQVTPGSFKTAILSPESLQNFFDEDWAKASEEVRSDFGNMYFTEFTRGWTSFLVKNASPNVDLVRDAIEHAVVGSFPRDRYLVGWDARILSVVLSCLPLWILTALIRAGNRSMMKVSGADPRIAVNIPRGLQE